MMENENQLKDTKQESKPAHHFIFKAEALADGEGGGEAGMPLYLQTSAPWATDGSLSQPEIFHSQNPEESNQENVDEFPARGKGGTKDCFNSSWRREVIQCHPEDQDDRPTDQERSTIDEIREILGYFWVGPLDEYDLERKWGSFGDRLPEIASQYFSLWNESIQRGAELADLPAVVALKRRFASDVRRKALGYIRTNRTLVQNELRNLGVEPSASTGSANSRTTPRVAGDEEVRARTQELTEIAELVQRAQTAQRMLTRIEVGYELEPQARPGLLSFLIGQGDAQEHARDLVERSGRRYLVPAGFSPLRPPAHPPFGDEEPPMTSYEEVRNHYADLTAVIEGYSTSYPSIYAIIQGNDVHDVSGAENSAQARRIIVMHLRETLGNMDRAAQMISEGDLDYHDLEPIVAQLRSGATAASGVDWSETFPGWVVDEDMRGHRFREFWITLGLGSLAAAGFIFMEIATLGTATFFIAATVALGASGALAARSWERYDDLSTAAGAEMSDETELVRSGQASRALVGAIVDSAFFFLAAKGVWSTARAGSGLRLAPPPAAGEVAMGRAQSLVLRRIEVLKARIANILSRSGSRDTVVATARRDLEQVHEITLQNAEYIHKGIWSSELQGLSEAQRNALATQLLHEVGREYNNGLRVIRQAELMVPRVVSPPAAGYGARPLGPPPVRRPPSTHGGQGWENW